MPSSKPPPKPSPVAPPETWVHYSLYERVRKAIASLPLYFSTETYIEGITATDIFTLNSALGAAIEDQVVATLNRIRTTWDPEGAYSLYGFVRKPQTFPDVVLRRLDLQADAPDAILLGIELKGWYILSKEGEPSFRYTVTPKACAEADLLVCVPWALKNVISGHPKVYDPYIVSARHAAELRNYYWEHSRNAKSDSSIRPPKSPVRLYPVKSDQVADRPASDPGGNFGRYARTGLMDEYKAHVLRQPICGVPAGAWLDFFKLFTESSSAQDLAANIARLRAKVSTERPTPDEASAVLSAILDILERSL